MECITPKQDPTIILELCDFSYDTNESITSFYTKCRFLVSSNLKRKGDKFGDDLILEDEIISPTFEDVIILWCLEKINPKLPKKVKEIFGEQIIGGQSVRELQADIFEYFTSKDYLNCTEKPCIDDDTNFGVKDEDKQTNVDEDLKPESCEVLVTELKTELDDLEGVASNQDDIDDWEDFDADNSNNDNFSGNNSDYDNNDFYNDDSMEANDKLTLKTEKIGDVDDLPISKRKRRHVCTLCNKVLSTKKRLDRHLALHANNHENLPNIKREKSSKSKLPVICDECGKTLSSKRRLIEHMKSKHDQNKTYTCNECNTTFKNQLEFKSHNLEQHKQKKGPEMCPECGKMIHFSSLKRHRLIHVSSSYRCNQCGVRCVSEEALEIHIRKHEEDPNYCKKRLRTIQCETCKRNFFDVVEYGSHVCKHFTCDMCDMSFVVERNLKKHKRVHDGENFFNCDMCESMYTKRKELQRHMRNAHDPSQRKYKCDDCGKFYLTKSILERHKGTHTLIKPHKCDRCGKAFQQKSSLDVHMMSHTGEKPFPCVGCDLRFRSLQEMKRHRELNRCRGFKAEDLTKAES